MTVLLITAGGMRGIRDPLVRSRRRQRVLRDLVQRHAVHDERALGDAHGQRQPDEGRGDRVEILLVRQVPFRTDRAVEDLRRVIGMRGQRHEVGPLRFPELERRAFRGVVRAPIDLREPRLGDKRVQVRERREVPGVEQVGGDVEKRPFALALRLRAARSARPRSVAVMEREGEEPGVVDGLRTVPALDDDFHIVVEADGRGAAKMLEGPHMLADRRREILRLDKPEIAPSRVAEDVAERVHAPAAFLGERDLEGRVVHLRLDSGARLEAHDGCTRRLRPQRPQAVLHDGVAAGEALGPELLIQSHGGDIGIPLEQGADVIGIRVELAPSDAKPRQCRMRGRPFPFVRVDDGGHSFPIDLQGARNRTERGPAVEPPDDLQPFELGHGAASKSRASAATAAAVLARRVKRGPRMVPSCGVPSAPPQTPPAAPRRHARPTLCVNQPSIRINHSIKRPRRFQI